MRRLALFAGSVCLAVSACSSQSGGSAETTMATVATTCEPAPDALCRGANLEGADLSGLSLTGIDLRQANLRGANLTGADLTQSVLIGADLTGANLDGARLVRVTADGTDFSGASVRAAMFTNASLRSSNFAGVDSSVAIATGADTSGASPTTSIEGFLDDDVQFTEGSDPISASATAAVDVTPLLEELTYRISRDRIPPTKAARKYTYVALAMFAATSPGDALLDSITAFGSRPAPAAEVDPTVAGLVAGSIVARNLFTVPADRTTLAEVADGLASRRASSMSAVQLRASFAYGREIAAIVLERTKTDGYDAAQGFTAREAKEPGDWVPTSPNFQSGIDPGWGTLTPFFASSSACSIPPPPRGSSANSPFQELADEVASVVETLTDEQKAIARFWDDGRGRTGTPAGHWLALSLDLAQREGLAADATLRMVSHALMAGSDAFIAVWREKYRWMVERPITILQRSNPDWSSYLVTPAFPEYPSGHSGVSRAIANVLTAYLGDVSFTDPGFGLTEQSRKQFNVTPRAFESFDAAANEVSDSRSYGGIHYRVSLDRGQDLGVCVADAATAGTLQP